MVTLLNLNQIPHANRNDLSAVLEELEKTRDLCRKLDEIIEHAPDGIYVTDGEANAIRINPAFARISGLDREKMLGRNHRELEKDKIVSRSSALMVVAQRKPITIIHEYLPTNKQALVTSTPVFDKNGKLILIVSSTRDLTELNDLKNKLAAERECRLKYERQIELIKNQILTSQPLIAVDKKTLDLLYMAKRMSLVESTVLITGETGVGKEEIAKYIHKNSSRQKEPFITINCGAIPENLVESELFGYEKGAFTGARQGGKLGFLEVANKGTIFLDEVGELPLETQAKLLRVLESRTIIRVGGTTPIPIDVRIISATNKDLVKMVEQEKFREDLYYRLNVVPICVPPLRERKDDIIPLVNHFLTSFNKKYGLEKSLSNMAYRILLNYEWPGNVRELKNVIERIVVTSDTNPISAEDLPMHHENSLLATQQTKNLPMKKRLELIEYAFITEAYAKHGSIRKAAKALQMTVPTFVRKRELYKKKYTSQ